MDTNISYGSSKVAVQHHYDVNNDFYNLWLDPSLMYSAALWDSASDLETAQADKLDMHIANANAGNTGRVLDIGCGWGALLQRLVNVHNVGNAVGLTLSEAQQKLITKNGNSNIEARLESWEEHNPLDSYDAIISICAIEHFAKPGLTKAQKIKAYNNFFKKCHGWLKPGGRFSFQCSIFQNWDPEKSDDFMTHTIFPESDLPYLDEILLATEGLFEILHLRNDRTHYVRTLREWLRNLRANKTEAAKLVGDQVVADYERYLQLSMYGYSSGSYNLSRITFQRLNS